jgi:nickel-type superoxide dismutase maturation protease
LLVRVERYHALRYPISGLLIAAVGVWLILRRPFGIAVEGESMSPTLRPGDLLVAARSGPIRRGALVVLEHPERPGYEMVKRLAGIPGDAVGGVTLGPDEFWLIGDNPSSSTDSRTMGPFARSSIRGVVRFRYWPIERLGPVRASSSISHPVRPAG